jgi:hypothetical protein
MLMTDQELYDAPPFDLSRVLADPDPSGERPRRNTQSRNDPIPVPSLDEIFFNAARRAVDENKPLEFNAAINNTDRTVGARLAGYIASQYGDEGLAPGTIVANFEGSAGQSFGAFCINGMQLKVLAKRTITSARAWAAARSLSGRRAQPSSRLKKIRSSATLSSMGQLAGPCSRPDAPGNAFACATAARWQWSRASAITVANT